MEVAKEAQYNEEEIRPRASFAGVKEKQFSSESNKDTVSVSMVGKTRGGTSRETAPVAAAVAAGAT